MHNTNCKLGPFTQSITDNQLSRIRSLRGWEYYDLKTNKKPQAEVEPQAYSLLITVLWRPPKLSSIPHKHRRPLGKSFWPWGLCTSNTSDFHPFIMRLWTHWGNFSIKGYERKVFEQNVPVSSPKGRCHVVTRGQLAHVASDPSHNKMTSATQFVFACVVCTTPELTGS